MRNPYYIAGKWVDLNEIVVIVAAISAEDTHHQVFGSFTTRSGADVHIPLGFIDDYVDANAGRQHIQIAWGNLVNAWRGVQ